jgi:hypothetical protein
VLENASLPLQPLLDIGAPLLMPAVYALCKLASLIEELLTSVPLPIYNASK